MPVDLSYLESVKSFYANVSPGNQYFKTMAYRTMVSDSAERFCTFYLSGKPDWGSNYNYLALENRPIGQRGVFFQPYVIPMNKYETWNASTGIQIWAYELPQHSTPWVITPVLSGCTFILGKLQNSDTLYACHIKPGPEGDLNGPTSGINLAHYLYSHSINFSIKNLDGKTSTQRLSINDSIAIITRGKRKPGIIPSKVKTITYDDPNKASVIGFRDGNWKFAYQFYSGIPNQYVVNKTGKLY